LKRIPKGEKKENNKQIILHLSCIVDIYNATRAYKIVFIFRVKDPVTAILAKVIIHEIRQHPSKKSKQNKKIYKPYS